MSLQISVHFAGIYSLYESPLICKASQRSAKFADVVRLYSWVEENRVGMVHKWCRNGVGMVGMTRNGVGIR